MLILDRDPGKAAALPIILLCKTKGAVADTLLLRAAVEAKAINIILTNPMRTTTAVTFMLLCLYLVSPLSALAMQTPTASPEASPAALDPAEARFGRLGGTLSDFQQVWGEPDWYDVGLIGYNDLDLAGVETITMVYYDAQDRIRAFLLVYLEKPKALDDPAKISAVAESVTPADGECADTPLESSQLGDQVYPCHSVALEGLLTPAEMLEFDVVGADGDYNYSINPTDDQYFEIVVKFGTDKPKEPSAPQPTPESTARPDFDKRYPPVESMDSLQDGSYTTGDPLSFDATILEMNSVNNGVEMLVEGYAEDGSSANIQVASEGDLVGYYPGNAITILGVYTGQDCGASEGCLPMVSLIELS